MRYVQTHDVALATVSRQIRSRESGEPFNRAHPGDRVRRVYVAHQHKDHESVYSGRIALFTGPNPIVDIGTINAVFMCMGKAFGTCLQKTLLDVCATHQQARHPIDDVNR